MFSSVLNAHAYQAERRARLLRVVPIILALHTLAVVGLARDRRETNRLPIREADDDAPILKILAARSALPSVVAAAALPATQASPRRVVARKALPLLKPASLPSRVPEAEETLPPFEPGDAPSPPRDSAEVEGGAVSAGVAQDSVEGIVVGERVGGDLSGALTSGVWAQPSLTPEEREALVERYMEALIRDRFEHVRYPHLAAAAGISGEVLLRFSINAKGRLLAMELLGRCPHPVLCDAAQEALRGAEPFPPPPPELGNPCVLELPFRYRLH